MPEATHIHHHDIAIAGGGPAGAVAALLLARAGLNVLLAHAAPAHGNAVGESLPPNTRPLLASLGLLQRVLADGHRPSHGNRSAWGSAQLVDHDFIRQLHGSGLQLDRQRFDASLRQAAREAGAEVIDDARLALAASSNWSANQRHDLQLRSPAGIENHSCHWLIDASGRAAVLSRQLGASRIRHDALLALQLRLRSDQRDDHDGSTLVESVADGWWYSLLLPDGDRLTVFLSDADLLDRQRLLQPAALLKHVGHTTHLRELVAQHGYQPHGRVHGHDACSSQLQPSTGPGWLALGDAAMAFDPLASKGIASAIHSAQTGALALLAELGGQVDALAQWQSRQADIYRVYREQLARVYAAERRWPEAQFWRRRILGPDSIGRIERSSPPQTVGPAMAGRS